MPSRSILIVGDSEEICTSLSSVLAGPEVVIHHAEHGAAALAMLDTTRPDLIVTEVHTRTLNGLDLLRLVRERIPSVDVLIITGYNDPRALATAARDGAYDVLVRPFDAERVREVVEDVLVKSADSCKRATTQA